MSTNYPTGIDTTGPAGTLPVETSTTPLATQHVAAHQNESDAIIALQTKVGVDSSAVTSTIDYKLKSTSSIDPGHKHNLGVSLADVLIVSPADGNGLIYNGSAGKWENSTTSVVDASLTVKGVTKLSIAPVSSTSPIAIGSNNSNSGTAISSSNNVEDVADTSATSAANKLVRANGSGQIDTGFINTNCGDGSDGNVTIAAGTTTLTRNMYYNNLTITGTLVTAGYIVYVKGTLSGAGTIRPSATPNVGGTGGNGSGGTGGTAGTGATAQGNYFTSKAGASGGTGANSGNPGGVGTSGNNATSAIGVAGVSGGQGGTSPLGANAAAGGGGTVTAPNFKVGIISSLTLAGLDSASAALSIYKDDGGSGGGGGGSGTSSTHAIAGGGGGGGGESGGIVMIVANAWTGTFTIAAPGGAGGQGGNGVTNVEVGGAGGGGAGGSGGVSLVFYVTKTWTGSYSLAGGTGGISGASGNAGNTGTTGTTGTSIEVVMSSLTL